MWVNFKPIVWLGHWYDIRPYRYIFFIDLNQEQKPNHGFFVCDVHFMPESLFHVLPICKGKYSYFFD